MKQTRIDDENALPSTDMKRPAVHKSQFFDNLPKFEDLDSTEMREYRQQFITESGNSNIVEESLDFYNRCSINTTADLKQFKQIQLAVQAFLKSIVDNDSTVNKDIIYESLEKLQSPLQNITDSLENRMHLLKDKINNMDKYQMTNPIAKFFRDRFVDQLQHVMKSIDLVSITYKKCLESLSDLLEPEAFSEDNIDSSSSSSEEFRIDL